MNPLNVYAYDRLSKALEIAVKLSDNSFNTLSRVESNIVKLV